METALRNFFTMTHSFSATKAYWECGCVVIDVKSYEFTECLVLSPNYRFIDNFIMFIINTLKLGHFENFVLL